MKFSDVPTKLSRQTAQTHTHTHTHIQARVLHSVVWLIMCDILLSGVQPIYTLIQIRLPVRFFMCDVHLQQTHTHTLYPNCRHGFNFKCFFLIHACQPLFFELIFICIYLFLCWSLTHIISFTSLQLSASKSYTYPFVSRQYK